MACFKEERKELTWGKKERTNKCGNEEGGDWNESICVVLHALHHFLLLLFISLVVILLKLIERAAFRWIKETKSFFSWERTDWPPEPHAIVNQITEVILYGIKDIKTSNKLFYLKKIENNALLKIENNTNMAAITCSYINNGVYDAYFPLRLYVCSCIFSKQSKNYKFLQNVNNFMTDANFVQVWWLDERSTCR